MNDFDDILKKLKEGLGTLADEAQEKYNDLINYLDTHDSDDIKKELSDIADKVAQGAREGVEKAKEEIGKINIEEKVAKAKEEIGKIDIEEKVAKAKEEIGKIDINEKMAQAREGVEKAKEELGKIDIDEKMAQAREGVEKAKEYMDSGLDVVHKQWEELRKRLNL